MDTTVSIKSINVYQLLFVGASKSPRWNVTVVLGVVSALGTFELNVKVEKAMTLDAAVGEAVEEVGRWGSRLGEYARSAIQVRIQ
jgi:hypothetical protein